MLGVIMKTLTKIFSISILKLTFVSIIYSVASSSAFAACKNNVVLVHGNTTSPSSWDNTVSELKRNGWNDSQIYKPNWGSKSCAACNDHNGSEETPVRNSIQSAINNSCTGKIDVIGHSMGVTLSAQQIRKLGVQSKVDTFVGVAGAWRGLLSCGVYPYNVTTSTCGRYGLSVSSPLLDSLENKTIANKVYSIKSWADQVVCGTGVCLVYGKHSSHISGENRSYTYNYGHFGLQKYTSSKQVQLIK